MQLFLRPPLGRGALSPLADTERWFDALRSVLTFSGHFKELKQIISLITADPGDAEDSNDPAPERQTLIFSATLFSEKAGQKANKNKAKTAGRSELDYIVKLCKLRAGYHTIDLSGKGLSSGLTVTRIACTADDKDAHLYYFLQKYPGRTLVWLIWA